MKINKMGLANTPQLSDRDGGTRTEKASNLFASDLMIHADNQSKDRLNDLLGKINEQGARLSQAPTFAELKNYRELVRQFLGEAVSRMYTLQSSSGWDRQGRQKMYTTIQQIDDQLSSMTEDIRVGQQRQLAIMDKLDVIRGMLVDLYT